MRKEFSKLLSEKMNNDDRIVVVTGDLGYLVLDDIKTQFPRRFFNIGSSEQAGLGICVGMSYGGLIPIFYSITNFAIFRPYEIVRNYINHEHVPVKIVCSGRDREYCRDGFTHWSEDAKYVLNGFSNIIQFWPEHKSELPNIVDNLLNNNSPSFLSLKKNN